MDKPQVSHYVFYLGPLVKPHRPDHRVRNARAAESVFHNARLGVGPVKHREIVKLKLFFLRQELYLVGYPLRFFGFARAFEHLYRLPFGVFGPELFFDAVLVVLYHLPRGGKDVGCRAVILFKLYRAAAGVIPLKLKDVPDVRPAPGIYRLVVVAHDADVLVFGGKVFCKYVLGVVGVLVLVNENVAEPFLVFFAQRVVFFERVDGFQEQVAEIEGARLVKFFLVKAVYRRGGLPEIIAGGERVYGVGIGVEKVVFRAADYLDEPAGLEFFFIEVQLFYAGLEHAFLVGGVVYKELPGRA